MTRSAPSASQESDGWLKAFYEGVLARGKLPKVALVASMRKLLSKILSVAKNPRPFVPQLKPAS